MNQAIQGTEKEFMEIFKQLCYSRSSWQVWADLICAMACSLSNVTDRTAGHYEQREEEYARCIERLGSVEAPAKILSIIVMALENEPEQDFLGNMYMNLDLGNHCKGQFFTPYIICRMMSQITVGNADKQIEERGYISVCDPACGAGATLIAAANTMKGSKYNFQNHVLFVGQDVDRVVAQMCYIQLSLLGCAGYICVGNTITNPLTGPVLFPKEKEGQELWYMPMFQSDIWHWRRMFNSLESMCGTVTTQKTVEKEHYYMFFDFDKRRSFMEINGFNENEISEQNKEALQSETWQEATKIMRTEAKHFTLELTTESSYGYTWNQIVKKYLGTGYKDESGQHDVTVFGVTYKVLKHGDVTAFCDVDGNILFDVTNERLEKEYEWLMNDGTKADAGITNPEEDKKDVYVEENADTVREENAKPARQIAKEKLEKELKAAKNKTFAEPIIGYLLERCEEDEGLAQDVAQEHKTWQKCFGYIYSQARQQSEENCAAVRYDIVYEWAEDYYHKDDKAEEEKKAKQEAERKAKREKEAAERKTMAKEKSSVPITQKKYDRLNEPPKPKKRGKDIEGQLDMFSMMGM